VAQEDVKNILNVKAMKSKYFSKTVEAQNAFISAFLEDFSAEIHKIFL
jgi:hypothetical protein